MNLKKILLSLAFIMMPFGAKANCPKGEQCYFLKIFTFIHATGFLNKGSDCSPAPATNANWRVNLSSDTGEVSALGFSDAFVRYQSTRFRNQSFRLRPFEHLTAQFCAKPISGPLEIKVNSLTLPPDCLNTQNEILHKVQECQPNHTLFQAHLLPEQGSLYQMNPKCKDSSERLSEYIQEFRRKASSLDDFMAMMAITIDPVYKTMAENTKKRCDPLQKHSECSGNCLGED